jgi:catechol-2,3-dioxygenase
MDISEWDWSRPIFDHVHLRVADLAASKAFY